LGFESAHVDACIGMCLADFLGFHPDPDAVTDEADAVPPYPGELTVQVSQPLRLARASLQFGTGTVPVFQLRALNDISAPAEFGTSQASAYWQDVLVVTASTLPANTQLLFVPVFSVSGQLSALDDPPFGVRRGSSGFEVSAARLNPGLGGQLGLDLRSLTTRYCTPDDPGPCGNFTQSSTGIGIPFFNGGAFTFRFWARAFANNSAEADLGNSIAWEGVIIRNMQGGVVPATIVSGSDIDYTVPEPQAMLLIAIGVVCLLRLLARSQPGQLRRTKRSLQ